jgi:hypothetical protein
MGRFGRFIVEYVGNLDITDRANQALQPPSADRRTNRHLRELVDWFKAQMDARGFPVAKKDELVHDLRRALRPGSPASVGVTADEAAGDGEPGWVPDAKGVSRDAPS